MDRAAEAAAELEPVFARLAEVQAECARLREQARRDAEQVASGPRSRRQACRGGAGAGRGRARRAGGRARAEADTQSARRIAEAERQAAALRERVERRLPGLVDRVVAAVLATGAEDPLSATTREAP